MASLFSFLKRSVIGNRIRSFAVSHEAAAETILTALLFTLIAELAGLVTSSLSLLPSFEWEHTGNPISNIADLTRHHTLISIVLFIASLLAARFAVLFLVSCGPSTIIDAEGREVDLKGPFGASRLADAIEISEMMILDSRFGIPGILLGRDALSGKFIYKLWDITDHIKGIKNNHVLIVSPSGGGKTRYILIPNIINMIFMGYSLVVFDPKGDLFTLTVCYAIERGYRIRILNLDMLSASDGWDIVRLIRISQNPIQRAMKLADTMLKNLIYQGNDFWSLANLNMLTLAFLHVALSETFVPVCSSVRRDAKGNPLKPDPSQRNFKEVIALIKKPELLEMTIKSSIAKSEHDRELLEDTLDAWVINREKAQIASGLSISMFAFRLKEMAELLSHDDIRFEDLAKGNTIFYIVVPWDDETFSAVTSTFFASFQAEIKRIAEAFPGNKLPVPVCLVMEEFASIGRIPSFASAMNNFRSYNIGVFICTQVLAQIKGKYKEEGECEAIIGNCLTRLCLGTMNAEDAKEFSEMGGKQTIVVKASSEERNKLIPEDIQKHTVLDSRKTASSKPGNVIDPDMLMRLDGNEMYVYTGGHNPFKCQNVDQSEIPGVDLRLRNINTGEICQLKPNEHIPHYISGRESLIDEKTYVIVDAAFETSAKEESSGVRYDKFL